MLNLLTIMVQLLSKSLLQVAIGAEIKAGVCSLCMPRNFIKKYLYKKDKKIILKKILKV